MPLALSTRLANARLTEGDESAEIPSRTI